MRIPGGSQNLTNVHDNQENFAEKKTVPNGDRARLVAEKKKEGQRVRIESEGASKGGDIKRESGLINWLESVRLGAPT